jgi:peptidoglycan hydrolase-like protein with peptidoglycan-binding domain
VSAKRPRRTALAGLGLVLMALAVAVVMSDPFAGPGKPSGIADNASETSLVTVTRRLLSAQTQVNATLGYAGAASIRVPAGTPPSEVAQAEAAVTNGERMVQGARASLSADGATLGNAQATVSATRAKEAVDCAGDNAAEAAPSSSPPSGEAASNGPPSSGANANASVCAGDVQTLTSDEQSASGAAMKVQGEEASLSSAQAALTSAEASAATARSAAADYGQGSTFTMLPAVGQVIGLGQSVFALSGQPTMLLFGSVVPSRAFVTGMSPGRDVAALNANLQALGYDTGPSGETFSAATEAAIRAFQSTRGMTVTGELPLGSVVFEPGPVRVTSVTPEVGASVTPGPVLGITSTRPQVTIALSAAEQSSVQVGDRVSIALPNQRTTPGVISSVGTVAKTPANKEAGGGGGGGGGENGEEGGPTVAVDVTPSEPRAIGHLDEAPVAVSITTASVPGALAVPVDALLALAGGGYALEVVQGGVHHLEAVTPGLFDDAEGLVQVSGESVSAGQRVVVPST